jgi:uncharacterized protein YigE (DUF2233 family)
MIRRVLGLAVLMLWPQMLAAVTCEDIVFDGAGYTICEVDARTERIELFLRDDAGEIYGQFLRVDRNLAASGLELVFAMNAGMYHEDRAPVGHYVEDGVEQMRVIPNAGPGNFGLLPNGVFCVREGRADVFETRDYMTRAPGCRHATQSGPMLVIDGALHPRFLENGTSLYVRNGVGTSADGARAVFAISNQPVNFHSFGRLFRDYLGLPNALFFDGNISRLYAPQLDRSDFGFALGPIVGVVAPRR